KINLLKSQAALSVAASGVRPVRAGGRAVRTARSWRGILPLYAPRTGGAYDSHHRTAEVVGRARWRGGHVAARGAGAAAEGLAHGGSRSRASDACHVERVP